MEATPEAPEMEAGAARQLCLMPQGCTSAAEGVWLSRQAAQQSVLLCTMIDQDEEEEEVEIPLPNVQRAELVKIVAFCEYHVDHCLCRWSEVDELAAWWAEQGLPGWSPKLRLAEMHRIVAKSGGEAEFGRRFPVWSERAAAALPPDIPKPMEGDADLSKYVSEWNDRFIAMDNDSLFELIQAAHFMDIQGLMDLGAAKVASLIKNKTPEEIREIFHIENDFTPEEEARIREENRWCEDL